MDEWLAPIARRSQRQPYPHVHRAAQSIIYAHTLCYSDGHTHCHAHSHALGSSFGPGRTLVLALD